MYPDSVSNNFKKIDVIIVVILIIIAGAVLISVGYIKPPITTTTPEIRFIQDDAQKILKVTDVSSEVFWENVIVYGDKFDRGSLGPKVVVGDEITNCQGTITIIFELKKTPLIGVRSGMCIDLVLFIGIKEEVFCFED